MMVKFFIVAAVTWLFGWLGMEVGAPYGVMVELLCAMIGFVAGMAAGVTIVSDEG